jgi:carotenoid cleavage dioxygenase-like enzyme
LLLNGFVQVKDRAALHMFGFTENYFVLFANSLQVMLFWFFQFFFFLFYKVKKRGICMLCCGKPILRTLNDNFCGELKIHFIPRRKAKGLHRFVVNTRQQGFVYHTINTFEDPKDGCIVVDAFVSKLNASRESSQFELGKEPVLDNEGDPFRFHIVVPRKAKAVVESKILCSTMVRSRLFCLICFDLFACLGFDNRLSHCESKVHWSAQRALVDGVARARAKQHFRRD